MAEPVFASGSVSHAAMEGAFQRGLPGVALI